MRGIYLLFTMIVMAVSPAFAGWTGGDAAYRKGDYALAIREMTPLALTGDPRAQSYLGLMYAEGQGVVQDHAKAVAWFKRAVEQNFAYAQNALGYMHSKGHGVARDPSEAVDWYVKAAAQGYVVAQYNLGAMYYGGRGVSRDLDTAADWFNTAAKRGHVKAQFKLGYMFNAGEGVDKDPVKAHFWWSIAAAGGAKQAVEYRDRLAKKMKPADLSEAKQLAQAWKRPVDVAAVQAQATAKKAPKRKRVVRKKPRH